MSKLMKQIEEIESVERENEHIIARVKWERLLKRIGRLNKVEVSGRYNFLENNEKVSIKIGNIRMEIKGDELEWSIEEFDSFKEDIILKLKKAKLIVITGFKKK